MEIVVDQEVGEFLDETPGVERAIIEEAMDVNTLSRGPRERVRAHASG